VTAPDGAMIEQLRAQVVELTQRLNELSPTPGVLRAEHVEIAEPDGTRRLTLSAEARLPDVPGMEGQRTPPAAGLLFFTRDGAECGGLVFGGSQQGVGPRVFGHLSFDRADGDQTLYLNHWDDANGRVDGIAIVDRERTLDNGADSPPEALRAWLGRGQNGSSTLQLCDDQGRPRLILRVDQDGSATAARLDASGAVVKDLLA